MGLINDAGKQPFNPMSLIAPIGQIGSSVISAISANRQMQKQFEFQKQLYEQQFRDQQHMIREQNEYNSYANQRKLMEEAGLNPMLMYQNGTSGALQSEVANPQVPNAPLKVGLGQSLGQGIDKGIQTMMSLAQVRLLESQIKKNESETVGQDILNRYTPQQFEQQLEKGRVDIDYTKNLIDKVVTDIAEGNSRIEVNKEQAKLLTAQYSETKLRALAHVYNIEYTRANTDLVRQKVATELLEQSLYAYRAALMSAQTRESDARTANVNSETFRNEWRNNFILNTGFDPDAGLWQLVTQAAGNILMSTTNPANVPDSFKALKDYYDKGQQKFLDKGRDFSNFMAVLKKIKPDIPWFF